jgi:hypothetical protein
MGGPGWSAVRTDPAFASFGAHRVVANRTTVYGRVLLGRHARTGIRTSRAGPGTKESPRVDRRRVSRDPGNSRFNNVQGALSRTGALSHDSLLNVTIHPGSFPHPNPDGDQDPNSGLLTAAPPPARGSIRRRSSLNPISTETNLGRAALTFWCGRGGNFAVGGRVPGVRERLLQ